MSAKNKNCGEEKCAVCGKLFTKNSPKQKTCSHSCSVQYHGDYYRRTNYGKDKCPNCGKIFIKRKAKQKFCSRSCWVRFSASGGKEVENKISEVRENKKHRKFVSLDELIIQQEKFIVELNERQKKEQREAKEKLFELRRQKKINRNEELLTAIAKKFGVAEVDENFIEKLSVTETETKN